MSVPAVIDDESRKKVSVITTDCAAGKRVSSVLV
jgi:hypothetical protein